MSFHSPFIKTGSRSSAMAAWAMLALMVPCAIYSFLYSPTYILHLLGYVLFGMLAEAIYTLVVKRKRRLVCMGSAFSVALLVASVPASMTVVPMLLAILFMVWIVKLPMTGLPLRFNAAMAGRFFLMIFHHDAIVNWGTPTVDVISTATPQELYRSEGFALGLPQLLFGRIGGTWEDLFLLVPGSPGETWPLITLLLGFLLCRKGIVAWRTPLVFLASFMAASMLFGNEAWISLFSAATVFSAVFIVTDPVSSPMSKGGQIAFGLVVGIGNALLRHYTYYTEAIVYAVLFGNLVSPLLDRVAFALRGRQLSRRRLSS